MRKSDIRNPKSEVDVLGAKGGKEGEG